MNLKRYDDSPVEIIFSFQPWIDHLKQLAESQSGAVSVQARQLLNKIPPYAELCVGTDEPSCLMQHKVLIAELMADLFPAMLTHNEIKAVTVPFQDVLLNATARLEKIMTHAGSGFDLDIRGFNHHQFYVNSCCLILNSKYGANFNFTRSLFYDIPDQHGIMKHYRILYNTDFMELTATESSVEISPDDIELLRDNFDDLDLWKKFFPKKSWKYKGFAIMSLFDATAESAVSILKGTLLGGGYGDDLNNGITALLRSIFKVPDLEVGYTSFDEHETQFSKATFDPTLKSYLLEDQKEENCKQLLQWIKGYKYFVLPDILRFLKQDPFNVLARRLARQGIQSVILCPVERNGHLLGIIELISLTAGALNSINACQLEVVMPPITDSINKHYSFKQSQVEVLIQNEFTSIHPSVYWKFTKEAQRAFKARIERKDYQLGEITFDELMPLYGQTDIKGSSQTRNLSVQQDLHAQLTALKFLLEDLCRVSGKRDVRQQLDRVQDFITDLHSPLKADTEQVIQNYLDLQICPLLRDDEGLSFAQIQARDTYVMNAAKTGIYHVNRRRFDDTVNAINQKMAAVLDQAQVEAQADYPHYYERFKTDGVDHNLYIGASISPDRAYDITKLYNLRLWQLQVICHMELVHGKLKPGLAYPLDVTSLVLVYGHPMSIRFRMDEKRFDVDGSYNARFEIIKKRIDKAYIKNSTDRLTAAGKIAIVYSNSQEEQQYLKYISFLQHKTLLMQGVEMLEVEELQGISGLKVMRVKINYEYCVYPMNVFKYSDTITHNISNPLP